jgi:formylglycine-generating enzyme
VDGLPDGTTQIVARSVLDGKPAATPEVWQEALSGSTSFALKLVGKTGRFAVGVEAWAGDCVTAWQSAEVMLASRADVALTLTPLAAPVCDGSFDRAPDMVPVPAGSFNMGCNSAIDQKCIPNESPSATVTLAAFQIDRTETTLTAYRGCVDSGACSPVDNILNKDYGPVVLTWEQANSYCMFRGKRLPTEAQWEKAARGTDWRIYPWGNDAPTCDLAKYDKCGELGPVAVGLYPDGASPYGALDMAGNELEWVSDWYDSYKSGPRTDPTGPASGTDKVIRGGSWGAGPDDMRTSWRIYYAPEKSLSTGVRCVR